MYHLIAPRRIHPMREKPIPLPKNSPSELTMFPPEERPELDESRMTPTPRTVLLLPEEEEKYQAALKKSWRRTYRLLGLDENTQPPTSVEEGEARDYSDLIGLFGLHYILDSRYYFVQPTQVKEDFAALFVRMNNATFELLNDIGIRMMFVAETLEQVFRTFPRRRCGYREKDLLAFNRSTQPYELTFMGANGMGVLHASRGNTHDITITDFYTDIAYIIRTDSEKFPQYYNIIDARANEKICELVPPLAPDSLILGNFDALIRGVRVGKIRQGNWMTGINLHRSNYYTRHGLDVATKLNPDVRGFLLVALMNAYFTFNVTPEPKERGLRECNPEVCESVFPMSNIEHEDVEGRREVLLNEGLFFSEPFHKEPLGVRRRISTGSIEIRPELFTQFYETLRHYIYKTSRDGLPYVEKMPESEMMEWGLFDNHFNPQKIFHPNVEPAPIPKAPERDAIRRSKKCTPSCSCRIL